MRSGWTRRLLRPRLLPVYAGVALLLALARPTLLGTALGGALVAAGLALRAWGAGHLVKTRSLATGGPYAHLRHPLYAGALLIGLGFGAQAGHIGLLGVATLGLPFFFLYYLPYKERIESARLERRYGSRYARYRARVPALVPRRSRRAGPVHPTAAWSLARFRDNHEWGTAAVVLAVALAFGLRLALPS